MAQRFAVGGAEDELRARPRGRLLRAQGLFDGVGHVDLASGFRGLGAFDAPAHDSLAHQDLAALEVDVLPLQAVDLGGP